ncbi:unnamed protein product [Parajaminaea phylloscopi]
MSNSIYDDADEDGPPHPDAHKKLSYAAKKRQRRKRREQEKKLEGTSSKRGLSSVPRQPKKQRTAQYTPSEDVTFDNDDEGHSHPVGMETYEEEEGDEDAGDEGDAADDYDFGDWDGSFANGVLIPMLPETGGSANVKTSSYEKPPAPPAVTDGGRVLNHDETWGESVLVSAWQAAQDEYTAMHAPTATASSAASLNQGAPRSPLWYDAPTPGSEQALKAQEVSEANKHVRALRLYTQRNQEQERKQAAEASSNVQANVDIAAKRQKALQTMQAASAARIATTTSLPSKKQGTASSAVPAGWPEGKRRIPPSIGMTGNAAWQAACATVASTKNLIGMDNSPTSAASSSRSIEPAQSGTKADVRDAQHTTAEAALATAASTAEDSIPACCPKASLVETKSAHGVVNSSKGTSAPLLETASNIASSHPPAASAPAQYANGIALPPPPPGLPDSRDDEDTFQSICMSWYYAGYYTAQWQQKRRESKGSSADDVQGAAKVPAQAQQNGSITNANGLPHPP